LAKVRPLQIHESVLVFTNGGGTPTTYNPIKTPCKKYKQATVRRTANSSSFPLRGDLNVDIVTHTDTYPVSIIRVPRTATKYRKTNPNEKPAALIGYFIRTYSDPGDLILDNTMGSGSTCVAAIETGRRFLGIEKDREFYKTAKRRIIAEISRPKMGLLR
jgi:site-specific DNA-methyltransferase (adenine-specific)